MSLKTHCSRRDFLSLATKGTALALLYGCAGAPTGQYYYFPEAAKPDGPAVMDLKARERPRNQKSGNYLIHEVAPMETAARLAQMYGVEEKDILLVNKLKQGESLPVGRRLIIPRPTKCKNIVPVYQNARWQFILVHHTAWENGKALMVDRIHRERGFEEGLGYHFLIDNGSLGKGNGQLEIAPRWIKQEEGAHCKAANMNSRSIGVALVGNFNNERPSASQLHTLTQLVALLGNYYHLPISRVLAHRQVLGARTDCPGKLFPWENFQVSLKKAFASPVC